LGLGLSIVERISRVLDHKIKLISKVGQGSMFSVRVPVSHQAAPSQKQEQTAPIAHAPLAGLRVIAVDNEPRILEGMSHLLTGWGCLALTAPSLAEARALLADGGPPDVIIADYHLDDGSEGLSLIAGLREDYGVALPAILITADRTPEIRAQASAADVQVLNKPLKPAALRAILSQWRVQRAAE
jgi:CheY-like chemotaxis protein